MYKYKRESFFCFSFVYGMRAFGSPNKFSYPISNGVWDTQHTLFIVLGCSQTLLVFTLLAEGLVVRDINHGSVVFLRGALVKVCRLETLFRNDVELIFLPVILNLSASRLYGRSLFIIFIKPGLAGYGFNCRSHTLGFRRLLALL